MSNPSLTALIWLVPHGFQIEIRDHSYENAPGNGTIVRTECRSFAGNYDTAHAANKLSSAILQTVIEFERKHLKSATPQGEGKGEIL